ncbi:hypothetical protein R5W23_003217 [Gemmata sp. JC673]|uniref:Uncharacterized protein n=1 Tax=Gemmata algarum TaxID=2975278 RepID=A0ABU5F2R1_9BACT|nr:hypothetical protein [Gemmata algarum]MDY3561789.1 hypothetical protein [Gemmata algarum]
MTRALPVQEFPPLTPQGLERLSRALDADVVRVQMSAASPEIKGRIKQTVEILKGLFALVSFNDPDAVGVWVATMKDQFKALTADLRTALGAALGETGACFYAVSPTESACVQITETHCQALGGFFQANTPCPS